MSSNLLQLRTDGFFLYQKVEGKYMTYSADDFTPIGQVSAQYLNGKCKSILEAQDMSISFQNANAVIMPTGGIVGDVDEQGRVSTVTYVFRRESATYIFGRLRL